MAKSNPYEDVEGLLFKGFLTDHLHFNGLDFVLKSLNDYEVDRVKARTPSKSPSKDQLYDCWYAAYSIFQINGISCLEDRENTVVRIFKALRKWPNKAVSRLIHRCLTFTKRISKAYSQFEAYCYEPQSRVFWKAYQNVPLNSSAVTGISGSELTPLTLIQIQWVSFNRSEDEKVNFDTQWSYVRWLGAFMNSKAAEKIESEVTSQKEREASYRQEVIARARGLSEATDALQNPYSRDSKDKDLAKLLDDLDAVINDRQDEHALAMNKARETAIEEYREFRRKERERKIEAINNQTAMRQDDSPTPFAIFDQKSMVEVEDFDQRRHLITTVLGIPVETLDEIDRQFALSEDLIQKFSPLVNTTKSTILPVNAEPGNFSGEILRGGLPKRPLS